ncbi:uncharacterized protein LOC119657284 isoform X2 [Hermetia illucens]|nr:uncharacterized protein LOC119657284 isoform X2 [Hermetia illucens]
MQLFDKNMPGQQQFKEKSLAEIGFNSTEINNWDKIVQPHKTDLLVLLEKMIKNYEKTNVQIRINDTTFNCHMMVLQCYSDFFMELNNEQLVVLPADKVTPQAFVMVYDWMLSSKPMVQREGILELFNAAQFLKIKGLVDQCWVCLDDDERFCEDAAFLLYLEARKFGHELIQQLMLTRICKFFLTLVASKEFLELTPKEICTLLQSNSIGVNTETEVLMAAVRWLNFNWADREQYMLEVMGCVRFGLMTPWQLVELRRNSDSPEIQRVVESGAVQKMIDDGLSYVTTKYWYASNSENLFHFMERLNLTEPVERQWVRDKTWSEHFECPNQMYSSYNSFLEYLEMIRNMGKDHWKTLQCHEGTPNLMHPPPPPPPQSRKDQCTQVQINKTHNKHGRSDELHRGGMQSVYYHSHGNRKNTHVPSLPQGFTGDPTQEDKNVVENKEQTGISMKDTFTDGIKILMPLFPVKQLLPNVSSHSGEKTNSDGSKNEVIDVTRYQILLFGGIDPFNTTTSDQQGKSVLQYSIRTNSWKIFTNMPGSRHHHSAIFYSGKIFIIGGTRPAYESILPTLSECVWSFDPKSLQWRNEKDLPYPRRDFGLVGTRKGIYLIGGEDGNRVFLASTIFLTPGESKAWIEVEKLRTPRTGLAAALVGNNIYAAGGIVGLPNSGVTNTVESYDLTTGHWTQISNLRKPRSFGKFCVLSNSEVFLIGGVTVEGNRFLSLSSVDKLDLKTKAWTKETNMNFARHGHDVGALDDKILIFGGVSTNKNQTLNSVECYSTTTKRWITGIRSLPSPLSGMAAVIFV